ncbi:MAG: oligonucleotide/oligosaccharide-binding fold domain-containing protein [Alkalispirochaetaceae bacterium]
MDPRKLPVYEQRSRILESLESSQVIVVESPTGSGKTTQLPLILHEAGYAEAGMIGVTQPRRIAAVSVSEYIAGQINATVGGFVGYKMRFDDHTSPETRIKIMTDGILLQEIKNDYLLGGYSVIMVDEAHERSLNIDFTLGLLKRVLDVRRDFRMIVSSATINAEVFSEYFDQCPIVRIETPMYPVQVIYDAPRSRDGKIEEQLGEGRRREEKQSAYEAIIAKITSIVERIIDEEREGDILIFLTGERMIKDCINALYSMPYRRKLHILPLYGRLSKEEQEEVFPPPPEGKIKIVVSTNISETSVTIDGITTVIDSGLAKINYYNPRTYTSSLVETTISKASANQRKGRAGRTRPGTCYRLYGKEEFDRRPLFTTEEIYRTDLSEVVLRMAELGIHDFEEFDFISSPGRRGIAGAVETLRMLDAIDLDNRLTQVGELMARFPLLPRHSRMIVEAIRVYPEVIDEVVTAAAFLTSQSPFLLPQGEEMEARRAHHQYRDDLGDFVSYLRLIEAYQDAPKKDRFCDSRYLDPRVMREIVNVKEQLAQIVTDMGVPLSKGGSKSDYLCAVAKGLMQFVCSRSGKRIYQSLTAERIQIHPGSVMFQENPPFIVAGEIVRTSRMYARSVSPLRKEWLAKISPELARTLSVPSAKREEPRRGKQGRDTTWQISVGPKLITLKPQKGKKKIAVLAWHEVEDLLRLREARLPGHYRNIKARVEYNGYTLLGDEKLGTVLGVSRFIDPKRDLLPDFPRRRRFVLPEQAEELCGALYALMLLAPVKSGSKQLGFIALNSNGEGHYWLKPNRSFNAAVTGSLASLEALADELNEQALSEPSWERLNEAYRRLAEIFEAE